mmetsp:Transcript_56212/g.133500  ORF Transcript_56212/g.133500 Transcript_56212/m.133500 type:complete len:340 (-) Transcript_56212:51-1070(-)|eukprot:CAMPEP_0180130780 /NCGR_PEP_ID=MMETSP0986-20121125/8053_1 /TAXON_ID=697907 /ORGANISM="non described non described, Strain CCMP2293" /LENGTH=339 /DNA_ID=CAMNT_0022070581 /DNA_START=330 /DNA_END=1349 /DNA_ORIENTATION=+
MTQRAFGHMRPGHLGQPVDYPDTYKAYGVEDVPARSKSAKTFMLDFVAPKILGDKKVAWNCLTTPSGPWPTDRGPFHYGMPFAPRFPDSNLKRTLHIGTSIKAEIDQRAERLPKRDPVIATRYTKLQMDPRTILGSKVSSNMGGTGAPTGYLATTVPPGKTHGTQTRFVVDVDATGRLDMLEAWDGSTEVDKRGYFVRNNQDVEKSLQHSSAVSEKLTAKRQTLRSQFKKKVQDQRFTKKLDDLRTGENFELYQAAMEKLKTTPGALADDEAKIKDLDRIDLVYSKDWKAKEYACDGMWAFDAREGRHCWSCCGSFQEVSNGCQPKRRTGQGWNWATIA